MVKFLFLLGAIPLVTDIGEFVKGRTSWFSGHFRFYPNPAYEDRLAAPSVAEKPLIFVGRRRFGPAGPEWGASLQSSACPAESAYFRLLNSASGPGAGLAGPLACFGRKQRKRSKVRSQIGQAEGLASLGPDLVRLH